MAENNDCSPTAQILCAKGCGFFGSASTMNMCSKCFREHEKASTPQTASPASSSSSVVTSTPPPAAPAPAPVPSAAPAAAPSPLLPAARSAEEACACRDEDDPAVAEDAPPPRKLQKNHSRCWSCRRKVGLLGFRCKCDYTFCAEHRYSDKHDCDFDFRTEGMAQLSKDNPVVVASKIDRI